MAKKSAKINLIYLIGMVVAAVGFCLPMFATKNPITKDIIRDLSPNGFKFLNFEKFFNKLADGTIDWIALAAILLFCGIILGIVFSLVNIKPASILRLVAILVMATAVGIILIRANSSDFAAWVGKGFWKHAYIGTYMIIGGWCCGLVGWLISR